MKFLPLFDFFFAEIWLLVVYNEKKEKRKDFDLIDQNWSIYAYWLNLFVLFFFNLRYSAVS